MDVRRLRSLLKLGRTLNPVVGVRQRTTLTKSRGRRRHGGRQSREDVRLAGFNVAGTMTLGLTSGQLALKRQGAVRFVYLSSSASVEMAQLNDDAWAVLRCF